MPKSISKFNPTLTLVVAFASLALSVRAATYDLGRDFSVSANPNGVWSYGYFEDRSTQFRLLTYPLTQGPMIDSVKGSVLVNVHSTPFAPARAED